MECPRCGSKLEGLGGIYRCEKHGAFGEGMEHLELGEEELGVMSAHMKLVEELRPALENAKVGIIFKRPKYSLEMRKHEPGPPTLYAAAQLGFGGFSAASTLCATWHKEVVSVDFLKSLAEGAKRAAKEAVKRAPFSFIPLWPISSPFKQVSTYHLFLVTAKGIDEEAEEYCGAPKTGLGLYRLSRTGFIVFDNEGKVASSRGRRLKGLVKSAFPELAPILERRGL